MARMRDAGQAERLLVQRQRGDGVDPPRQGQVDRGDEVIVSGPPGTPIDPAGLDFDQRVKRIGEPGAGGKARSGATAARPPADRRPGPWPCCPTRSSALRRTPGSPMTSGAESRWSTGSDQARASTSGPMPATSPIVKPTRGRSLDSGMRSSVLRGSPEVHESGRGSPTIADHHLSRDIVGPRRAFVQTAGDLGRGLKASPGRLFRIGAGRYDDGRVIPDRPFGRLQRELHERPRRSGRPARRLRPCGEVASRC